MKCKLCNSKEIFKIINLGKQPLANKYPKNKKDFKNEKKYLLQIMFCNKCKNANIKKIISRKELFENYYYLSSVNLALVKHFEKLAKKIKNKKFVLDIGSNDGILLKPLKKLGVKAIGIDPSKNVSKIANDRGFITVNDFFNYFSVKKIIKLYSKPDLIVASSIFTHLENPLAFIKNIKRILDSGGTFILEVEYLINFIKNLEFERFYFDRPFYYSLNSIKKIIDLFGMSLVDVEEIDIHGGSLRLFIKNSKNIKISNKIKKMLQKENNFLKLASFKKFNILILNEVNQLKQTLISFKKLGKKIIGYGAPARVATITNFAKIDYKIIDFIIDDSPLKQNRFTPGTHIPIYSNKKLNNYNPDIVIVFAYEYFKEIKYNFKNKKCLFYKPIPFAQLKG